MMLLFNAITGELKEVPKSILRINMKEWEYVFSSVEEIPLKKRQELLNAYRLDDEIFRPIPQTEHFFVSNYGRVKRIYPVSQKEKIMTPFLRKRKGSSGGVFVKIKIDGKCRDVKISSLVAMCFSLKGEGNAIYHINKNPWDNSVTNLKQVDQRFLIKVPQRLQRQAIIKVDPVTLEELNYYPSIREAGRQEFLSHETIRLCLKGELKTAGGFIWRYDH